MVVDSVINGLATNAARKDESSRGRKTREKEVENKKKLSVVLGRLRRGTAQAHSVYLNLYVPCVIRKTRAPFEFRRLLPSNVPRPFSVSSFSVVIPPPPPPHSSLSLQNDTLKETRELVKFIVQSEWNGIKWLSYEIVGISMRFRSNVKEAMIQSREQRDRKWWPYYDRRSWCRSEFRVRTKIDRQSVLSWLTAVNMLSTVQCNGDVHQRNYHVTYTVSFFIAGWEFRRWTGWKSWSKRWRANDG